MQYYYLFFFFFLMIRRPPRSTLFPTRRSSDLNSQPAHRHQGGPVYPTEEISSRLEISSDRKSTRLNSSHPSISYAVFCLKKKNKFILYNNNNNNRLNELKKCTIIIQMQDFFQ